MTRAASAALDQHQRRTRVEGDRVACWRIGSVDLDRCRECVYLLRLVRFGARGSSATDVVCADVGYDAGADLAW